MSMNLHSEDPAFPFEVTALRVIYKEGDLRDKDSGEVRHYQSFVVQCLWDSIGGSQAVCLAKPVNGYLPDKMLLKGRVRLAVTSASSSGGQLNVRFSGFEPVK